MTLLERIAAMTPEQWQAAEVWGPEMGCLWARAALEWNATAFTPGRGYWWEPIWIGCR